MAKKKTPTKRTEPCGPRIIFDERDEPMTGLIVPSGIAWDTPNAWTVEALVTFPSQGTPRTDQVEMRIVADPGDSRFAVRKKLEAVLVRICAVEATVLRMRPPLDLETIQFLQEVNAELQKGIRARQAEQHDRDHEEAIAMNERMTAQVERVTGKPALAHAGESRATAQQLAFA